MDTQTRRLDSKHKNLIEHVNKSGKKDRKKEKAKWRDELVGGKQTHNSQSCSCHCDKKKKWPEILLLRQNTDTFYVVFLSICKVWKVSLLMQLIYIQDTLFEKCIFPQKLFFFIRVSKMLWIEAQPKPPHINSSLNPVSIANNNSRAFSCQWQDAVIQR